MISLIYNFSRFRFEFDVKDYVVFITDFQFKRKYKLSFTWHEENPFQFELVEKL